MKTDIVLINPRASHGIYGALGDELIAVEPPLWLRLTAAYLAGRGHAVAVIDAERERLAPAAVAARVEALDPRLVGLLAYGHQPSASTQCMPACREVAEALAFERTMVIAGGHVSALPEITLLEEPCIDYAIKGEGPATFDALLVQGERNQAAVPGLVWRNSETGEIVVNLPAPALDPDADLGAQGWAYTPPTDYVAHNWHGLGEIERKPYASIYTSLNCPFVCRFCCISSPFGAPGYKTRSPIAVVDEIEMLHRAYGVRMIKIVDEMFVLKPSHYLPICEEIIRRGLGDKLNIWAYSRIDTVKPATLGLLRSAGIRWLALGIEAGNAEVRDGADKHLRTNDIVGTVRAVQAAGINVIGNFMFGFRSDTLETMRQTLDMALACRPEWANFYCTMAYPGSKLYDEAIAEGWTLPSEWRGYSQHNADCRPLDTEHVDAATVLRFRDNAFREYFSDPGYREMMRQKFGESAIVEIDRMLQYRLKRKLLGE